MKKSIFFLQGVSLAVLSALFLVNSSPVKAATGGSLSQRLVFRKSPNSAKTTLKATQSKTLSNLKLSLQHRILSPRKPSPKPQASLLRRSSLKSAATLSSRSTSKLRPLSLQRSSSLKTLKPLRAISSSALPKSLGRRASLPQISLAKSVRQPLPQKTVQQPLKKLETPTSPRSVVERHVSPILQQQPKLVEPAVQHSRLQRRIIVPLRQQHPPVVPVIVPPVVQQPSPQEIAARLTFLRTPFRKNLISRQRIRPVDVVVGEVRTALATVPAGNITALPLLDQQIINIIRTGALNQAYAAIQPGTRGSALMWILKRMNITHFENENFTIADVGYGTSRARSEQYALNMPIATVIHPYDPQDDTLSQHHLSPAFPLNIKFSKYDSRFVPASLHSNVADIPPQNIETRIVVQDLPWIPNIASLKPQPWLDPYMPYGQAGYSKAFTVDTGLFSKNKRGPLLMAQTEGQLRREPGLSTHAGGISGTEIVSSGDTLRIANLNPAESQVFFSLTKHRTTTQCGVVTPQNRAIVVKHIVLNAQDMRVFSNILSIANTHEALLQRLEQEKLRAPAHRRLSPSGHKLLEDGEFNIL